jgi:hypothetical protein
MKPSECVLISKSFFLSKHSWDSLQVSRMPRCEFPTFAVYMIEMTDLGFLDQWDCCSRCFVDIDQVHPDHHMVAIHQADDYIRGKDEYKEYHPNVRCDRESTPFLPPS